MRNHTFLLALLLCFTNYLSPMVLVPAHAQTPPQSATRFGMNVEDPLYNDFAYVDVIMGGFWCNETNVTGWTSNGYPKNGSVNFGWYSSALPSGIYNFYVEGDCDVAGVSGPYFQYFNGSPFVPGSYHRSVNSAGVTVTTCQFSMQVPVQNMNTPKPLDLELGYLAIWNINPKNTASGVLNNMHLTAPGYPAWQEGDSFWPQGSYPLFSNEYIQSLSPFCCLRFMDWMNTNNNNKTYSWANHPDPSNMSNRRICYENMIDLCNKCQCDMWINTPLMATDDWRINFAKLVKGRLDPRLHCYIEYSNEIWNWGFAASQTCLHDSLADGYGGGADGMGKEMGKYAMRNVVAMQPVLGDQARFILAGQFYWTIYCQNGLEWIQQNYGTPSNYIWGIAGAPYYALNNNKASALTTDAFFASIDTMFTTVLDPAFVSMSQLAKQYNVHLCTYEQGQSIYGADPSSQYFTVAWDCQQDPRMAAEDQKLAALCKTNNYDVCNWFTNSGGWNQFGFWGVLPYTYMVNNPTVRYQAEAAIAAACDCGFPASSTPPDNGSKSDSSGSNTSGSNASGSATSASTSSSGSNSGQGNSSSAASSGKMHDYMNSPGGVPWFGSGSSN